MKPFKFKTKATVLKGVKEEAPKRKTNWDRVIYMLLFLFIFLSVLYYAISKNFYVNVWGHVHTEQFSVQFPEDVSVYNYFVGEDDTVEKGDTLFYYRQNMQDDDNSGGAAVAAVVTNSSDWYLKERLQTQKKISLDYIAIEDQKNNIARIKKEIEKTKKEVYLDVYPQAELKKVMLDMDKYYVEIDKLKQEMKDKLTPKEEELKRMNETETLKIKTDIINTTKAVAKDLGVDIVLDKKAIIVGGIDMTDAVIKKLNKK